MRRMGSVFALAGVLSVVGCERSSDPAQASIGTTNDVASVALVLESKSFDELTVQWSKRDAGVVNRKAIRDYLAALKVLPEDDREMALSRALNLLPDENIGILAGILMDHEIWDGLVKLAYVEILNRDDKYKLPLLKMIVKDPKHSCREEAGLMLGILGAGDE